MNFIAEYYTGIKIIHVGSVLLSGLFFFIRGVWVIRGSSLLGLPWVRISPHVIDTLLLVSAVMLAVGLGQYPFTHDWLTAKVIALLAYIGFGMLAIRHGRDRRVRIGAWLIALLLFSYIVSVALSRNPYIIF